MSRSRLSDPALGDFTRADLIVFFTPVLILAGVFAVIGWYEPFYFTAYALEYNDPLNQAFIFNHWSSLCLAFLAIGLIVWWGLTLSNYLLYGWTPRTQIIFVAGFVGLLFGILLEDFVAHLRYGALPADDWTHWIFPTRIMLWTNFWLPMWYIFVSAIGIIIIAWFGWSYLGHRRSTGGRRTE